MRIYLFWSRMNKDTSGNFGDELGPYIIHKLSGCEIYRIPIPRTSIKLLIAYFIGIFSRKYTLKIFPQIIKTMFLNGDYIISVGSIIGSGNGKRIVWGSGIISMDDKIDNGRFLAVRGKYTAKKLEEFGYNVPVVLGDPALLLPVIFSPNVDQKYEIGIIPHYIHYEHFILFEKLYNIKVIDLHIKNGNNIEDIIKNIKSCKRIISTSLHGIIVSHAYHIPALWYEYPPIQLDGDRIKFLDYFSSVGIDNYEPYKLEKDCFDENKEIKNIDNNTNRVVIQMEISSLQKRLLKIAPFPILEQYL